VTVDSRQALAAFIIINAAPARLSQMADRTPMKRRHESGPARQPVSAQVVPTP